MLKSHLKSLYLTDEITTGNPRLLSITLAMQATDYLPRLKQVSKKLLTPPESTRAYSR